MNTHLPIVVIGGGTAGCTVVSTLASLTSFPIVLVEPAPISQHDDDEKFFDHLSDEQLHSTIETTLVDGGIEKPYVQARSLGGGSAINGLLLTGEAPPFLEGLTRMATDADCGQMGKALLTESGRHSRLWWNGGRWNPGRAVQHLVDEGRVSVVADAVSYLDHSQRKITVAHTASEAVEGSVFILSAGALLTPSIMLHSSLERSVPGIGDGLQNHPTVTFGVRVRESIPYRFDASVVRESTTSSGAELLTVAYERASFEDRSLGLLSVSLMNPDSRGAVWRSSTAMHSDFNMLATLRDRVAMREAVRELISTATSEAFTKIAHEVLIDEEGPGVDDLAAMNNASLDEWIYEHVALVSHATSSCHSIVDDGGMVRGISNLYIADASILQSVPSCTPAGPVVMEASRIARALGETLV